MKQKMLEVRKLLEKAQVINARPGSQCDLKRSDERSLSNFLRTEIYKISKKVIKRESLPPTFPAKKHIATAVAKKLDWWLGRVSSHFQTCRSKVYGLQAGVVRKVEDAFTAFSGRLVTFMSSLMAARRKGIVNKMNNFRGPHREILEACIVESTNIATDIGYSISDLQ